MPLSSNEYAIIERPWTNSKVFAHPRWDAIPVSAALLHCVYFFGMFYLFPRLPLWVMHSRFCLLGEHFLEHQRRFAQFHSQSLFSVRLCSIGCSASWNQSRLALVKSSTNAFTCSITRETPTGRTSAVRPSIGFRFTKHGDEGEPEHTLKYTFLSFFREDPKTVFNELKRKDPHEALWGIFELGSFVTTFMNLGI